MNLDSVVNIALKVMEERVLHTILNNNLINKTSEEN